MLFDNISCYLQWFAADLYLDFALEVKIKVQTRESYKKEVQISQIICSKIRVWIEKAEYRS